MKPSSAEADALALIAEGFSLLARAARARAATAAPASTIGPEWVDPGDSPLGRRRTLALARAGTLASTKIGRKVLISKASLDAYLERHRRDAGDDLFAAEA